MRLPRLFYRSEHLEEKAHAVDNHQNICLIRRESDSSLLMVWRGVQNPMNIKPTYDHWWRQLFLFCAHRGMEYFR